MEPATGALPGVGSFLRQIGSSLFTHGFGGDGGSARDGADADRVQRDRLVAELIAEDAAARDVGDQWRGRSLEEVVTIALANREVNAERDVGDKLRMGLNAVLTAWAAFLNDNQDIGTRLVASKSGACDVCVCA